MQITGAVSVFSDFIDGVPANSCADYTANGEQTSGNSGNNTPVYYVPPYSAFNINLSGHSVGAAVVGPYLGPGSYGLANLQPGFEQTQSQSLTIDGRHGVIAADTAINVVIGSTGSGTYTFMNVHLDDPNGPTVSGYVSWFCLR